MFFLRKKRNFTLDFSSRILEKKSSKILEIKLEGSWKLPRKHFDSEKLNELLDKESFSEISFSIDELKYFDSTLICFLLGCLRYAEEKNIRFDRNGLSDEILQMLDLAVVNFSRTNIELKKEKSDVSIIVLLGEFGYNAIASWEKAIGFLGETIFAWKRFIKGRARFRWRDCFYFIYGASVEALPIVSLISFITGMILAYIGTMQLEKFGASIFVSSLIAIAMFREMGVIMTSVIMAGRTGSAFAAQLGSMKVNDEIDAFRVMGINPMEYLVLPRIVALAITMPFLTIYSNFVGMLGGFWVMGMNDITFYQYWEYTVIAMNGSHVFVGLFKAVVFGVLVAWAGCFRGMMSGKGSLDVGNAATSASVLGITLIVVFDGVFAVLFSVLGI